MPFLHIEIVHHHVLIVKFPCFTMCNDDWGEKIQYSSGLKVRNNFHFALYIAESDLSMQLIKLKWKWINFYNVFTISLAVLKNREFMNEH